MEETKHEFDVEKTIRELLSDGKEEPCLFDRLLWKFESFYERPVSSLGEMKRRDNKREKGLAWEKFCQFYLLRVGQYKYVWLWNELPEQVRLYLKLGSRVDNGIDLVACRTDDLAFSAIQCKYRKKTIQTVTWTTLSTFIGLCARTGPWVEQIVMTNCKGVSRKAGIPKSPTDRTVAYGTFKNLSRAQCLMPEVGKDSSYRQLGSSSIQPSEVTIPKTQEELRALRLAKFSGK